MVLEKAAGMRLLLLKCCNWTLNVVGFQLYYYFFNCIFFLAVLLSSSEFSLLGVLLTDYESREISVEVFVYELLKLISDEEKVNFHKKQINFSKIIYLELCNFKITKAQSVRIFGHDEFLSHCIVILNVHIA